MRTRTRTSEPYGFMSEFYNSDEPNGSIFESL